MAVRRITIRVPSPLHDQLLEAAIHSGRSLNQFLVDALEGLLAEDRATGPTQALQDLSLLLAPAAIARGLTEKELSDHVREIRRRIWDDRYRQAVEAEQGRKS